MKCKSPRPFLSWGEREVTVKQFREFVEATEYKTEARAQTDRDEVGTPIAANSKPARNTPGEARAGSKRRITRVVLVKLVRCRALSASGRRRSSGKSYRLPTEAEWESVRVKGRAPGVSTKKTDRRFANVADLSLRTKYPNRKVELVSGQARVHGAGRVV